MNGTGPVMAVLGLLADRDDTSELGRPDAWTAPACRSDQEFAAIVSHDLKNPLSLITGHAQLLRRKLARAGALERNQLEAGLAQIERAAAAMVAMIDELMDVPYAREGSTTRLERRPTDLVALARRVATDYQQLTDRHRLHVRSTADAVVGSWDASRLERVLVNLLSNAIKYSPDGGEIDVLVSWDSKTTPASAVLRVRDRGIGIPPSDLPRIFDGYHRAHNAVERASGTGVGLLAVRQIVEQHGGHVNVKSREGRGSRFTVRLPLLPVRDRQ
ncbi:MAG: HAMP domain-containing histidine kinase [Chloroflexi bacterium]|nr:HAMP domain-containing histidine kinase [Chloroflexota bacterium]